MLWETLIGGGLGVVGGIVPQLMAMFQAPHKERMAKLDMDQERFNMEMQLKLAEASSADRREEREHEERLENVEANLEEFRVAHKSQNVAVKGASQFVKNIQALVRPGITCAYFLLFMVVKITLLIKGVQDGVPLADAIILLWDAETHATFSAIMLFWFTGRPFDKIKGVLPA